MKRALYVLAFLGIAAVSLYFSIFIASEIGEVVVLTTRTEDGGSKDTRLWVVDHDGAAWLRAGSPESQWLSRLRAHPQITVARDGEAIRARAEVDPASSAAVNKLMQEKYGLADSYIALVFGRNDAVAVRLEAIE